MIDPYARCEAFEHRKWSSVRHSLREDIHRYATFSVAYRPALNLRTYVSIFLKPTILCLFWYRISHCLYLRGWRRLADVVARWNLLVHKANLPAQSCIGPGCFLGHCPGVTFIGSAGRDLAMLSVAICCPKDTNFGKAMEEGPCLGDRVKVGAHAVVYGKVWVGDNVRIVPTITLAQDCEADAVVFSKALRLRLRRREKQGAADAAGQAV